jgi:hypothetical protein
MLGVRGGPCCTTTSPVRCNWPLRIVEAIGVVEHVSLCLRVRAIRFARFAAIESFSFSLKPSISNSTGLRYPIVKRRAGGISLGRCQPNRVQARSQQVGNRKARSNLVLRRHGIVNPPSEHNTKYPCLRHGLFPNRYEDKQW